MTPFDTPPSAAIELVPLTQAHLPEALALSQAVHWPHRLDDWELNLSVSKGVAAVAEGRTVGTAMATLYGPVATLGMIIVDGALRGRGLGRKMMEQVIALAGDRELRLVGTPDGLPLYRKMGFEDCGRVIQLRGTASAATPEQPVVFGPADLGSIADMDRAASGMERDDLLSRIAETGETLTTDGGFAILRRFGKGHVLGPVVARDAAAARALIAAGVNHMQGQFLRIDMIEDMGLAPFVEGLGLAVAGDGTCMVRDPKTPTASGYQTHALVSQALG